MKRLGGLLVALLMLSSCGSSDEEASGSSSTTDATDATTTTVDPATLGVRQDLEALEPSDFVIAPPIVSTQSAPGQAESSLASGQLSSSDVQRQEQLLSELEAKRNAEGIVVSLPEVVLFDFGKSDLRGESAASLDKVNELVKFYPRLNLSIEGHTDNVGSVGANQALSERRAIAVRDALAQRGVAGSRMTTVGHGENRPAVTNDSDANRQKNRRVEIVFKGA